MSTLDGPSACSHNIAFKTPAMLFERTVHLGQRAWLSPYLVLSKFTG
jgi:hypothetical protein